MEKFPPEMFECEFTKRLVIEHPEARLEVLRLRSELDHVCRWLNELRRDLARYEGRR